MTRTAILAALGLEGCPNYNRVKDTRKGEAFFCTEAKAKKAGFTKSESYNNNLH